MVECCWHFFEVKSILQVLSLLRIYVLWRYNNIGVVRPSAMASAPRHAEPAGIVICCMGKSVRSEGQTDEPLTNSKLAITKAERAQSRDRDRSRLRSARGNDGRAV